MINKKIILFILFLCTVCSSALFVEAASCTSSSRTGSDSGEGCAVSFTQPYTNSSLTYCSPVSTTYQEWVIAGRGGGKYQNKTANITSFRYASGNTAYLGLSIDYCGKCSNGKCDSCPLACDYPQWSCSKNACSASTCGQTINDGCGGTVTCGACPVSGSCGTINNTNQTWPSSGTWCSSGTQSSWTQRGDQSNSNLWKWSCNGSGGGSSASCSFTQQCGAGQVLSNGFCVDNVVNGSCGTINGANETWPANPTGTTWCSSGAQNGTIEGIWNQKGDQSNSNLWKWSCNGSGGGSSASCLFTQQCGAGQVLSNGNCITAPPVCSGQKVCSSDLKSIIDGNCSSVIETCGSGTSCGFLSGIIGCRSGINNGGGGIACSIGNFSIPDGSSSILFKQAIANVCTSTTVTCTNGSLSSSDYKFKKCVSPSFKEF